MPYLTHITKSLKKIWSARVSFIQGFQRLAKVEHREEPMDTEPVDIAEQNRQNARQIFLDSPNSDPGTILTGNTGEVKFALLPEVDEAGDDYVMARWEETCYRAGPAVDWLELEYHKRFTFWFRGQPLQMFEKQTPKSSWQKRSEFSLNSSSLEQPLPTVKQSDRIWAVKFHSYYMHHLGSLSTDYDATIDLEKMEVRCLTTEEFDPN